MLYVLQTCSVGWHSEELVTTNIHVVNTCTLCMGSFYLPYMWFYDVWKYFTYISPRSITGWMWTVVMNSFVYSCENINLLDWLNAVLFKQRLAPWVFRWVNQWQFQTPTDGMHFVGFESHLLSCLCIQSIQHISSQ